MKTTSWVPMESRHQWCSFLMSAGKRYVMVASEFAAQCSSNYTAQAQNPQSMCTDACASIADIEAARKQERLLGTSRALACTATASCSV